MAGRILRLKDMIAHTGLSRTVIYERMNEKSTRYAASFPKSFSLGGGAIGWFQSDVDAWLESCAATAWSGTKTKKVLATPGHINLEMDAPAKQMALSVLPLPSNKLQQKRPSTLEPTDSQSSTKRSTQKKNLAEVIVTGGSINDRILQYLQLKEWTPGMGAMLISGIDPLTDGKEIPHGGVGLDGVELHGSNPRFNDARRILREWHEWKEDQQSQVGNMKPIDYLNWCIDENITSEWLRLILDLADMGEIGSVDLTSARFALLTNR